MDKLKSQAHSSRFCVNYLFIYKSHNNAIDIIHSVIFSVLQKYFIYLTTKFKTKKVIFFLEIKFFIMQIFKKENNFL